MELWIRGQEKDILTRVNTLAIDDDEPTIFAQIRHNTIELGTYGTKERALEVLDEITDFIDGLNKTNTITIYEMPKE